tara:strand:- start:177 stop:338 length:162 start_codon:yes stop_codon:yes gene_type:complete
VDWGARGGVVAVPVPHMIRAIRVAIIRWMLRDERVRRIIKQCAMTSIEEKEWK